MRPALGIGTGMAGGKRSEPRVQPARGILRFWGKLNRDQRGATILEFGIIAAPLFALLIAIVETSLVFFAQQGLETAAEAAARQLLTGNAQQAGMSQDQFKQAACASLPPFLKCANLIVDVQQANTFSAISLTSPNITYDSNNNVSNSWSYTPGGGRSIMVLRLMYIWNVPLGPMGFNLSKNAVDGKRLLVATSVFQAEPYT